MIPEALCQWWASQRPHFFQLLAWLGSHAIGGLLPLWGSFLLLALFSQKTSFEDYVQQGEFALYAASVLGTAFYLILRELRPPFPGRVALGLIAVVLVVAATLLFAGVFVGTRIPDSKLPTIDIRILSWSSLGIYVSSVVVTLIAMFIDLRRAAYDLRAESQRQIEELAESYHQQQ